MSSSPLRLLLLADTHLGLPSMEYFASFERALLPALRGEVDLVVHGGDVLYRSRVKPDLVLLDALVEAYKRDLDRTLLRESLQRTPTERLLALQELQRFADVAPGRRESASSWLQRDVIPSVARDLGGRGARDAAAGIGGRWRFARLWRMTGLPPFSIVRSAPPPPRSLATLGMTLPVHGLPLAPAPCSG
jgi:hypothetical protein